MRKNIMRRCLITCLAAFLLAACALPGFAAEPGMINFQERVNAYGDGQYSDVTEEAWYTVYVRSVYELGLMIGDTSGRFRPLDGINLAETAALAARLHKIYSGGGAEFQQGSPWYQVYVDYCLENGILTEAPADCGAMATRRQFAAMLAHALPVSALQEKNPQILDGDIPDVPADSENAEEIYLLYRAGVLTGNDAYGSFTPNSNIRRSEVAAVVARMASRSLRREIELEPKPPYPDLPETSRKDDEFFYDAAMLGNSLVDGMMLYSGLGGRVMAYYGKTGATVNNHRLNEMLQYSYNKIYIEFGINEIGLPLDTLTAKYSAIVKAIQEKLPEADIYVMAVTPVTKAKSYQGSFTMTRIREVNAALYQMCEELQCWYLDCCELLCDEEGYLPLKYAGWDGSPHLAVEGYVAWAEVIRTHTALHD